MWEYITYRLGSYKNDNTSIAVQNHLHAQLSLQTDFVPEDAQEDEHEGLCCVR